MSTRMSEDYVGAGTAAAATSAQQLARDKPVWSERMMTALPSRVDKGWFSLMDKVTAINTLWRGWDRVRRNDGAAGIDRLSVGRFEAHAETRLGRLQAALLEGSYQPFQQANSRSQSVCATDWVHKSMDCAELAFGLGDGWHTPLGN
jgi:hypothetical protein